MRALVALALATAATSLACEAVPDITYVEAGSFDGPLPDGNTCPDLVPSYATACCGVIPCFGANCVATCADCQACSPLDLCCPNAQNHAVCKSTLTCP